MTTSPPFTAPAASPLAVARRYADADMRHQATPTELHWLHQHPLLWLRALVRMRHDTENHIAKDRLALTEKKPGPGEAQHHWLRTKASLDRRTTARLHFIEKVKNRTEEVKALVGADSALDAMLVGDVIADLLSLAQLAQAGDLRAVRDKSLFMAERWARRYGDTRRTGPKE